MALTVDSNGTDVVTQHELARIRAEALARPAVAPQPDPVPRPIASGPIELPATVDRRPVPASTAPAPIEAPPAATGPAQGGPEELDAVYTANGGQLGEIADRGAQAVGILPGPGPFLPTLPSGTSTPESRLAGDALNGSRGGAASGLFTAAQGIATQGAVDSIDVAAAVVAQGVDDIAAGVARTQVVGPAAKWVATKLGPVAAASTIVANFNAAVQGGTRESIAQGITHATLDLAALGGAALAGTAVGGPLGAVVAVAGFAAYQLVGPQVKELATDAVNGAMDWVGETFF